MRTLGLGGQGGDHDGGIALAIAENAIPSSFDVIGQVGAHVAPDISCGVVDRS